MRLDGKKPRDRLCQTTSSKREEFIRARKMQDIKSIRPLIIQHHSIYILYLRAATHTFLAICNAQHSPMKVTFLPGATPPYFNGPFAFLESFTRNACDI